MKSILRTFLVLVVVTFLGIGTAGPAAAAPPPNDTIRNAVAVPTIPFTYRQTTTDATTGPLDPVACGNKGSVWFRFTPSRTRVVNANTIGSDYDTVLSVYSGRVGSFRQIACNDDFRGTLASSVRFTARAGTVYYFLVARCCGTGGTGGGHLVFDVRQGLTVGATVNATGIVHRSDGTARIGGTIRCGWIASAFVTATLRQRVSRTFFASGDVSLEMTCSKRRASWSAEVVPKGDVAFVSGRASVAFSATACTERQCSNTISFTRYITLNLVTPKPG